MALLNKNRDALIAILKSKFDFAAEKYSKSDRRYNHEANTFPTFYWKDGVQILMLLITCTPENCCKDYGRFEIIKEILLENKLDFAFPKEFVAWVPCSEMKGLLQNWIVNTESDEMQRSRRNNVAW